MFSRENQPKFDKYSKSPVIRPIEPQCLLKESPRIPIIDVRSPGEFEQGHIPGAINIPLFSDAERAVVGTLYVHSGKEEAVEKGLNFAVPKTDWFIETLREQCSSGEIILHCWRGGLRSAAMAEVFSKAGFGVALLTGGYKAYRRFVREQLSRESRIMVLGGFTGSGKTELLHAIACMGEQVVDLEGLACHKGSAFGALGQAAQPTNEQFENNLYQCWSRLDPARVIWMEDESRMIGRITLPDPVFEHICKGVLIRIELDMSVRINRLVKEYSGFDKKLLADAVSRIGEQLGGTRTKQAMTALDNNRFDEVAAIALSYYDKAYQFSTLRRNSGYIHELLITGEDTKADAARLIEFSNKCT